MAVVPFQEEHGSRREVSGAPVYNTAVVRSTYVKVLVIQAVVLAGLWILQQAFL
jgi:hypothetical protein